MTESSYCILMICVQSRVTFETEAFKKGRKLLLRQAVLLTERVQPRVGSLHLLDPRVKDLPLLEFGPLIEVAGVFLLKTTLLRVCTRLLQSFI